MFHLLPLIETHAFHICHKVKIMSNNMKTEHFTNMQTNRAVHAMKQKYNLNIEEYLNMVLWQNKPLCCILYYFPL